MKLNLNNLQKAENQKLIAKLNPKSRLRFEGWWAITVLTIFTLSVGYFFWNLAPVEPGARSSKLFEVA